MTVKAILGTHLGVPPYLRAGASSGSYDKVPGDMPGYSGTPLPQKLGIKPATNVALIDAPPHYRKLLGSAARSVKFSERVGNAASFVHLFATERSRLDKNLRQLRTKLADTGTVWVSWPKRTSGVQTDITEDVIRAVALPLGFVDVKVCAVDDIWSGLKLMIRREQRQSLKR